MELSFLTSADRLDATWRERFLTVNGVRLHVVESGPGDGPLVLLLHGFPEYSWSWRFQLSAPALARRFHLVAPDLRGYNLSDKPASGYDIATLSADVREVIAALGERQADVVGHDWGGAIAWAAAIREPESVRRLVVLNAPHPAAMVRELRRPTQAWRSAYMGFFQLRGIAERAMERDDYAMIRRTFRAADRGQTWLTDEDIARYVAAIARPGALTAALEYYRQLPKSHDRYALSPMRVIAAPTLVLWGELDPYLGVGLLDGLERWVRDVTVRRFPTAGHWLNQQEPEQVNAALLEFLSV